MRGQQDVPGDRWTGGMRGVGGALRRNAGAGAAALKGAAALSWLLGLGFGLPCAYAIWYFADRGEVWTFLGFPTYGDGPFESIGIPTTVPLLVVFFLVCGAEVAAGGLLWQQRHAGAVLALALLPVEFAFWIGFALPAGLLLGPARTVLIMLGWPSLGRRRAQPADRPAPSPPAKDPQPPDRTRTGR